MSGRQESRRHDAAPCAIDEFWLPTAAGATSATWFRPLGDASTTGVLIVSGIIHEQQTMAVGVVALARDLATHGIPALTVDLTGTANGAGSLADPDVGACWDDDVRSAVRHMRESGLRHVIVVGVRLGALIAAHATVDDPVDLLVMWSPVLSGRRYTRELQMMQAAATDDSVAAPAGATLPGVTVAGFNVPPALLDHLKSLDAGRLDGKPAAALCIVDSPARLEELDDEHPLFEALPVQRVAAPGTEDWLFTDADAFPAPFADIAVVRRHVERVAASFDDDTPQFSAEIGSGEVVDPASRRTRVFEHDGVAVRETFVSFAEPGGSGRLVGILSEPVGPIDPTAAYLAVTCVGPGRIFVDLARGEAARGRATLRFELAGFGTSSPPPDGAWAEFYHPTAPGQIGAAADVLAAAGHRRIHVVGFCAGAWSAFQVPPRPDIAGIVAINAQLLIRSRLVHRRHSPNHSATDRLLARIGLHPTVHRFVEKLERDHPLPSPTIRRVGRHAAAGTAVTLAFAEGDLGHRYFTARARRPGGLRRRGPQPDVRIYTGLGHLPAGAARRQLLADLHDLA